jgi:replicative DNA helicase
MVVMRRLNLTIDRTILSNLIHNEEYLRKVLPFCDKRYFQNLTERTVFEVIEQYVSKYNNAPSKEALQIDLSERNNLSDEQFKNARELIDGLTYDKDTDMNWLVDQSEKFCQEKAVYNAIMDSIKIIDDKNGEQQTGMIPEILSNALAISFDSHIGHDFIEDAEERFDFYQRKESRIPFDLDFFNKITKGGIPNKTLNIALAGTGVGKSLFMCHCAASNLMNTKNVLYITMEMAEEKIAERIDANLLNVTMDELKVLPKDAYEKKMSRVSNKTTGKLIIKEYPTASAGAGHFRHLLNELKLKRGFKPDIIYIDYLNICMSSRLRHGANVNSYTYVKAIAEELRGLAVEFGVPVVSATQTTRSGFTSSDIGLEDTSESFGLPATADLMFALISTEELQDLGQIMVKQLKNRYSDPNINRRFVLGVDRAKMRLYDAEQEAQDDVLDGPVFDETNTGARLKEAFKEFT